MLIAKSIIPFILAGLCEIGGGRHISEGFMLHMAVSL